jgi:uncharacterized SAM-binding protein YcdF (DUF218 family)
VLNALQAPRVLLSRIVFTPVPLGLLHNFRVIFLSINSLSLEQGVGMKRVTLESQARTTRENAKRVAALLGERCKQPWLLVTSAWHMPRSMSEFQAVGCNVTAYPVDFRTGEETSWTEYSMAGSLMAWQTALHEYLGMFVYGVTR